MHATPTLTFDAALVLMKLGVRVRRQKWAKKGIFLKWDPRQSDIVCVAPRDDFAGLWTPSDRDTKSTDWESIA
jgi:hypothetical protein